MAVQDSDVELARFPSTCSIEELWRRREQSEVKQIEGIYEVDQVDGAGADGGAVFGFRGTLLGVVCPPLLKK